MNETFEDLKATGIITGAREGAEYRQKRVTIESVDVAVLYTDGITESVYSQNEIYGEERLKSIIRA